MRIQNPESFIKGEHIAKKREREREIYKNSSSFNWYFPLFKEDENMVLYKKIFLPQAI